MIILISAFGNHSNQLIQTAQFEVFCKEHSIRFRNIVRSDLTKMIRYRQSKIVDAFLLLLLRTGRKIGLVKYINLDSYNITTLSKKKLIEARGVLLVSGFTLRDNELMNRNRDWVINRYRNIERNPDLEFLKGLKENSRNIIGIHIRQGDYAKYAEGRYFYTLEFYIKTVNQFIVENKLHNPFIVIFSDQELPRSSFDIFNEILISRNDYNVDYELMGLCSYIIGPPSTFTLWASYSYKVPYYHIKSQDYCRIKLEEFDIAFANNIY